MLPSFLGVFGQSSFPNCHKRRLRVDRTPGRKTIPPVLKIAYHCETIFVRTGSFSVGRGVRCPEQTTISFDFLGLQRKGLFAVCPTIRSVRYGSCERSNQ